MATVRGNFEGNSLAAAHLTALAASLLDEDPDLDLEGLADRLHGRFAPDGRTP